MITESDSSQTHHCEDLNAIRAADARHRIAAAKLLRIPAIDPVEINRELERGISFRSVSVLRSRCDLSVETIEKIAKISHKAPFRRLKRWLARPRPPKKEEVVRISSRIRHSSKVSMRLTAEESERLYRLSLLIEKAAALQGDDIHAGLHWLKTPKRALANEIPLEMAETEEGFQAVERLIGQLEHGVFV